MICIIRNEDCRGVSDQCDGLLAKKPGFSFWQEFIYCSGIAGKSPLSQSYSGVLIISSERDKLKLGVEAKLSKELVSYLGRS